MKCIFTISGTCICESNEPCKARIAIDVLEQQLKLEHKVGWELARNEARDIASSYEDSLAPNEYNDACKDIFNAITTMNYKE